MSSMLGPYADLTGSDADSARGVPLADAARSSAEPASDDWTRAFLVAGQSAAPESSKRMNLAGVDLVSLRLVVLCAETRSLSAAARYLNMSLSSASHRLSHFEELFGTRFFERDYQGTRPTAAGRLLVVHARVSLDIMRSCRGRIDSLSVEALNRQTANLRIAMDVEK